MHSEGETDNSLNALTQVLRRGIAIGNKTVPHFQGIDWNIENVLLDGTTPILVDGFYQQGATIWEGIHQGTASPLTEAEIAGFLNIPYLRRPSDTEG